jgi:hypothetical protein
MTMPPTTPDRAAVTTPKTTDDTTDDATSDTTADVTRGAALDPALARAWTPLLLGADRARALALVDEIATALSQPARTNDPSLRGAAARALFYAYFAEAAPERALSPSVDDALLAAVDGIARTQQTVSLCEGFVGVGWVAQHLVGRFDDDGEDANAAIDDALATVTDRASWSGAYELLYGLGGIGVYALERIARPSGRQLLAQVVTRLDELAERQPGGVAWRTAPSPASAVRTTNAALGHYDCGVAHGVPGLVPLLAGACAAGVEAARARPLLDGAVRWLLDVARLPDTAASSFPDAVAVAALPAPTRLGWCYGDPGVAAALLAAARAVDEPTWAAAARAIALRAAERALADAGDGNEAGLQVASLCHGSVGVALLMHRLWSELGDEALAAAARLLYVRTLALQPLGRAGGFRALSHSPGDGRRWTDDRSLFTGGAGLGLALLAATGTVEPAWDRLLAASLAPRAQTQLR